MLRLFDFPGAFAYFQLKILTVRLELTFKPFPIGNIAKLHEEQYLLSCPDTDQIHFHRDVLPIAVMDDHFLCRNLPVVRTHIVQPSAERLMVGVGDQLKDVRPNDGGLSITQDLLLPFVHGNDKPILTHHQHRIGDKIEEGLISSLGSGQLLGAFRHRLFESNGVSLQLLLQPSAFRDIPNEGTRMDQPTARLIEQSRSMNLNIDGSVVLGQQHGLD